MAKQNWCYDPKPDITTYELARALDVILDAMQRIDPEDSSAWEDAKRHFREASSTDEAGIGVLYQSPR